MTQRLAFALVFGTLVGGGLLGDAGCTDSGLGTPEAADLVMEVEAGCVGGWQVCGCKSDMDCPMSSPRCDRNTSACVACLPQNDNCAAGSRCSATNTGYACAATCRSGSDCVVADGGAGAVCCMGTCVDQSSDPVHCGGCGHACPVLANATAGCHGSACGIGACTAGYADCNKMDVDGCEVNQLVDLKNCGGCGKVCAAWANGVNVCQAGACMATCNADFLDCNRDGTDGCEVNAPSDVKNCGGCGKSCAAVQNGLPGCHSSTCSIESCDKGFRDCNKLLGDGCEINVLTDAKNCSICGVACDLPFASSACKAGGCVVSMCNAGYADCDVKPDDGCEINLLGDPTNCGVCRNVCYIGNGTPGCAAGACTVASCNAGYGDCDKDPRTGCEDNISKDLQNCGACGYACPAVANGLPNCSAGACRVGSCNFGFDDCNKDVTDGCEANLLDIKSCGKCGVVCAPPPNASAGCNIGACGIGKCNPFFADCNNQAADGCERSIAADVMNCGACNKVCTFANASPSCVAGVCGILSCNMGYGDCDKNINNGCEAATDSDASNCGGCGVVCPKNLPYCVSGVCAVSSHNLLALAPDYNAASGCGDSSSWWSQNFGQMTYQACENLANKYGAQYMGETGYFPGGNYAQCPYQYFTRWVGEADANNAWVSTNNWSQVNSTAKANMNYCVLAYANANAPGNATFNSSAVSLNGQTYFYNDYGVTAENTCYSNARLAGARPLNPWMLQGLANPSRAHMVESHTCHGSVEYTGLAQYSSDGGGNHTYRCVVGYTP